MHTAICLREAKSRAQDIIYIDKRVVHKRQLASIATVIRSAYLVTETSCSFFERRVVVYSSGYPPAAEAVGEAL